MKCEFTYWHYEATLAAYSRAGYEIVGMKEYASRRPKRALILRHDVDFCPGAAMKMYQIELAADIKSTFLFRTGARFYNLASANASAVARHVMSGAEVGLHFEYDVRLSGDWICQLNTQMSALERITREMTSSVSLHCPASNDGTGDEIRSWMKENEYVYAYSDELFRDIKYLSDSRGAWREECFCRWVGKVDRLQVLTHPIWWHRVSPGENY